MVEYLCAYLSQGFVRLFALGVIDTEALDTSRLANRAVESGLIFGSPSVKRSQLPILRVISHFTTTEAQEPLIQLSNNRVVQAAAEKDEGNIPIWMLQVHVGGFLA